jgi:hypothetical protein
MSYAKCESEEFKNIFILFSTFVKHNSFLILYEMNIIY